MLKIKRKGGVYAIRTVLEKIKYPEFITLKIGHSENLKKRFSTYNTSILDVEDKVQNHINFIVHSPKQAFSGTRIMEKIFHAFYKNNRQSSEFFQFETFDIKQEWNKIVEEFEKHNIDDIKYYYKLNNVPQTLVSEIYPKYTNKNNKKKLVPRDSQVNIVNKGIEYYKKYDKGGIYIPPGFGKTYIATIIAQKLQLKNVSS